MNRIGVFIKVTHRCNLNCSYCYDRKYSMVKDRDIDLDTMYRMIDKLSKYYTHIGIMYHGGEPLLMGEDFYRQIHEYCTTKHPNIIFNFIMQSNGLLYRESETWIKELGIGYGTSYDGLSTDKYRSGKCLNLEAIFEEGKMNSMVLVASHDFLNNILSEYEYLKSIGIKGMKLNYLFGEDYNEEYDNLYVESLLKLFEQWIYDSENPIDIDQFVCMLKVIGKKSNTSLCRQCAKQWIGLDVDGLLGPCDFGNLPRTVTFGNIHDVEDIGDVLWGEKRLDFFKQVSERTNLCIEKNCKLVGFCDGGCNATIYTHNGSFNKLNEQHCRIYTSLYEGIGKILKNSDLTKVNHIVLNNMLNC